MRKNGVAKRVVAWNVIFIRGQWRPSENELLGHKPLLRPRTCWPGQGALGRGPGTTRIAINSGKGKEPMSVEDADRRLNNADLNAEERPFDDTNPAKRRRTSCMTIDQTQPLEAVNDPDQIGLNILDSSTMRSGMEPKLTEAPIRAP